MTRPSFKLAVCKLMPLTTMLCLFVPLSLSLSSLSQAPNGQKYMSSQCLALDRVIKIMMKYTECRDWEITLKEAFPKAHAEKAGFEEGGGVGKE